MDPMKELLLANPIGILSLITIFGALLTVVVLGLMFIVKSHKK